MAATREFQVTGTTCAHCERAITREVGQILGVEKVEVSAATGRLIVSSTDAVDDEQVLAAVDEAGYTAIPR